MSRKRKPITVKVKEVILVEKDIVEVENICDFILVSEYIFKNESPIFDLFGTLYLIGTEVAYIYKNGKMR